MTDLAIKKREHIKAVFEIFEKNYVLVPLEVFAKDPFKTLLSTVLSARTKDEVTLEASQRLFKHADTIEKLADLPLEQIEMLIYPVGFYKTKAKHLKRLASILLKRYHGKIPQTQTSLMTLPGVGRKTANLVLNRAFDKPAIAVDTHVHRITNMLGWVRTNTPEQTDKALHLFLPKRYWSRANRLFVSIGRQYTTIKKLESFLKSNDLLP